MQLFALYSTKLVFNPICTFFSIIILVPVSQEISYYSETLLFKHLLSSADVAKWLLGFTVLTHPFFPLCFA